MAKLRQPKFPPALLPLLKKEKIKLKKFTSAKSFEKVLLKFLKEQNVLHLCTCRNNQPRATPLEYRLHGLTFYILSEGGGKFNNLKVNKNVSFSIAAPYDSNKDFWGAKGLQAWGKAKVYSMKDTFQWSIPCIAWSTSCQPHRPMTVSIGPVPRGRSWVRRDRISAVVMLCSAAHKLRALSSD